MKKLFIRTNGFNAVAFVDDNNRTYMIDNIETLEDAKKMDYSGIADCETAEEIDIAIGAGKGTIDFTEVESNVENEITEF